MARRLLLGFDVGSSSVKASLVDADSGKCAATAFYPEQEAPIIAVKAGWAEQDPQMWWDNAKLSLKKIMAEANASADEIAAIVGGSADTVPTMRARAGKKVLDEIKRRR